MRKFIALLFTALLAVGLTACGGTNDSQPEHTATASPSMPQSSGNDVFCQTVFDNTDWPNTHDVCNALISFAHTTCTSLDHGATFTDLVRAVMSEYDPSMGWSQHEWATNYGFVIGAGIATYCPQHKDVIPHTPRV